MRKTRSLQLMTVGMMIGCTITIASCDKPAEIIELGEEITTSVEINITIIEDSSEYNAEIPVGERIPIKVTNGRTYEWTSLAPSIAYVKNDSINAVKVGKADIIDRKGSKATIHVTVTN